VKVSNDTEAGERRAWGWVAALRDGATTPWHDFAGAADRGGRYLPGAQQLELLRRLNAAGRPGAALVERVLTASAPGRGRPDLQLIGAAEESRFGPRPVDPAELPDAELVRVATSLIAEDLVAAGTPPPRPPGRPRPWRRAYRLVGDPWLADPIRAELRRRGRPPGGRRPTILVVGTDLATMLADAWTARSFAEGGAGWRDWLGGFAAHDRMPPRADLVTHARTWADRVGRDRVQIVVGTEQVPSLVGVRRPLPAPPAYSADAVDLARQVSAPLGLLVLPERRAELLRGTLGPRLADGPGGRLGIPTAHAEWVQVRAARMRDALLRAGYAVHGDPDALVPDAPDDGTTPDDAGVLTLAVRLLLNHGVLDHGDHAAEGVHR
jgi:hypothetical protein